MNTTQRNMTPVAELGREKDYGDISVPLLDMASAEIERMRAASTKESRYHSFPPACLSLLKSVEGNHRCVDCGEHDPQWATVSFGALLCLQCSGQHRSFGVQVSCVRSITMDEWSLQQVIAMLEGGNSQLYGFFSRHALSVEGCPDGNGKRIITKENVTRLRYKTKAAEFYRQQMVQHVSKVLEHGRYRGRAQSRRLRHHPLDKRNSTIE
jgi:hypothetical protein